MSESGECKRIRFKVVIFWNIPPSNLQLMLSPPLSSLGGFFLLEDKLCLLATLLAGKRRKYAERSIQNGRRGGQTPVAWLASGSLVPTDREFLDGGRLAHRENDYRGRFGLCFSHGIIVIESNRMDKKFREGQSVAGHLVESLIDTTLQKVFEGDVGRLCQSPIAKHLAATEYQSIEQTRATKPSLSRLPPEDHRPSRLPTDTIRPFSAKVHQRVKVEALTPASKPLKKGIHQRSPSIRSSHSMRSNRTIISNSNKNVRKEYKASAGSIIYENKLIALQSNVEEDDQCDRLIQRLRKVKTRAEEYDRNKENFMKEIVKDNEEYTVAQKRLASALCRKEFTYSYNGGIIDIPKSKMAIKKKSRNCQQMRNATRKSESESGHAEKIVVSYNTNDFKNEKKKFLFEEEVEKEKEGLAPLETRNMKFSLLPDSEI